MQIDSTLSFSEFETWVDAAAALETDAGNTQVTISSDSEAVLRSLRNAVGGPITRVGPQLDLLIREITIQGDYNFREIHPYLEFARALQQSIRNTAPADAPSNWQVAINLVAENRNVFHVYFQPGVALPDLHAQFVSRSARLLREMGHVIEFERGQAKYSEAFISGLNAEIEALCTDLGGINMIANLLLSLQPHYYPELNRYVIPRVPISMNGKLPDAQLPWAYLLLLGTRFLLANPPKLRQSTANGKWQRLVSIVMHSVALLDLQPLTQFDGFLLGPTTIWDYLSRGTRFESLCFPVQLAPSHFLKFPRALIRTYKEDFGNQPELNLLVDVAEAVVNISLSLGPRLFDAKEVTSRCPRGQQLVDKGLKALETPKLDPAGSLKFIPNTGQKSFNQIPLFSVPERKYFLASSLFSAPTFLESIFAMGRQLDKDFDSRIGLAAEAFMQKEFRKKGIGCVAGKYGTGKNDTGDCDLVVETSAAIYFFEIKKKTLVKESIGGDAVSIFINIVKGLVKAQIQALKHELSLREHGQILLTKPDGQIYALQFQQRAVKRITVLWNDLGFLHDKSLSNKFMEIFDTFEFQSNHPDKELRAKFNDLRKEKSELQALLEQLSQKFGAKKRELFFSARLLSIPILLTILDRVSGADEFIRELHRAENVSTGTHDWYSEYARLMNIPLDPA